MSDWPTGKYKIIYADPPWHFKTYTMPRADMPLPDHPSRARHPAAHYKTMEIDEISKLAVNAWSDDDSILVMWVYDPMLPRALEVANAWGFNFCTVLFRWIKATDGQLRLFDNTERLNFGTGYHTRGGGCEEAWLFKRGKGLPVLKHDIRKEFYSPVREHSRKPDEVADWIVQLYGDVPRLEMFARTTRPGWSQFGNEVSKFEAIA